jgi:hypothetical protein
MVDEIDLAEFQQRVQLGQSAEYVDMMQRLQTAPGGMMPGPQSMGMLFGGGMGPGGGDRRGGGGIEFMRPGGGDRTGGGQNSGGGGRNGGGNSGGE